MCPDALVDEYLADATSGADLKMRQAKRIVESAIVNTGMIAITLYSLYLGGEATVVGAIGLIVLGAYNGVAAVDYRAIGRALGELQRAVEEEGESRDDDP